MTNDELIQKLRGLERYDFHGAVFSEHSKGAYLLRADIEELINELEKPKLFCETVNAPCNHSMSYSWNEIKSIYATMNKH